MRAIPDDAILELHPAGTSIKRAVAPKACRTCQPDLQMRLRV
jgi:hypothetical protein